MPSRSKSETSRTRSEAARANGAKSQGPVTPEGRAASARNSLRHGLSSQAVVLPHESAQDFESLRDSYADDFQPATSVELDLVEAMAAARWRLRRLYRIETEMFELEMLNRKKDIDAEFSEIDDSERVAWVFQEMANQQKCLTLVLRYEGTLTRSYDRAFKQLQILQSARTRPEAPPRRGALQNEPKPAPDTARPASALPPEAAPDPTVSEDPHASAEPATSAELPSRPDGSAAPSHGLTKPQHGFPEPHRSHT